MPTYEGLRLKILKIISILAGSGIADTHRSKCDELGIRIIELPERKKVQFSTLKVLIGY